MKIGHPKNFWGGVLFAVIGLLFAVIAKGIPEPRSGDREDTHTAATLGLRVDGIRSDERQAV